ncbi:hypothetical protein B0H13DRAFT_2301831 [Mycena leptocephala]|nr:hypothetical protein B0H13DRAFT_2301831 [Mycena leptocephala]
MSTPEEDKPRPRSPDCRVLSYEVATTTVFYGLPPYEQQNILKQNRHLFHEQATGERPAAGLFHAAAASNKCQLGQLGAVNISYDIACQYYKNLHALDIEGTHTYVVHIRLRIMWSLAKSLGFRDSDDSIFSDDEGPPPLIPAHSPEPSEAATVPMFTTPAETTTIPAETTTIPAETTNPWNVGWNTYWSSVGLGMSRANSPGARMPGDDEEEIAPLPAAEGTRASGLNDGEFVERAWAELNLPASASGMGPGSHHTGVDDMGTKVHQVRIIALRGVRDVECACTDGLHSGYGRCESYAFLDQDGHVVIKKSKTLLWLLN